MPPDPSGARALASSRSFRVPAAETAQTRCPVPPSLTAKTSLCDGAARIVEPAPGSKFTEPLKVPVTSMFPDPSTATADTWLTLVVDDWPRKVSTQASTPAEVYSATNESWLPLLVTLVAVPPLAKL